MTNEDITKKSLLEKFVVDNQELEQLESLLDQFNIFEAVGMVRQEIRHSHFLAFLLNPSASHRLGDIFLKAFLKRLLISSDNAAVSAIEVDVAALDDTKVRREWKNIDILLFSEASRIVCVIENKVDSGEHSDQLRRYHQIVEKEFSEYQKIFVFLTPQGILPYGDEDQQYWSIYSYSQVSELISDLSNRYRSTIGSEVYTLMQHYSSLINRHLMQDSEIAKLCRQIYWQHKEALDLIYEHRPDLAADALEFLRNLVSSTSPDKVVVAQVAKTRNLLSFAVPDWDELAFQSTGPRGWIKNDRILVFQFQILPSKIILILLLAPGKLSTRQAVFDALVGHEIAGFTNQRPISERGWLSLVHLTVSEKLSPEEPISEVFEETRLFWQQFLSDELPKISKAILEGMSDSD